MNGESRTPKLAQVCIETRENKLTMSLKICSIADEVSSVWTGFWRKHENDVLKLANKICGTSYKWKDRPGLDGTSKWSMAFSIARAEILLVNGYVKKDGLI